MAFFDKKLMDVNLTPDLFTQALLSLALVLFQLLCDQIFYLYRERNRLWVSYLGGLLRNS